MELVEGIMIGSIAVMLVCGAAYVAVFAVYGIVEILKDIF